MRNLIKLTILSAATLFAFSASADAPDPQAASVDITADIMGTILNGGLVIGGDAFVETSIATFHDGTIGGDVTIDVEMVNYGIAVANGGLVIGGDLCAKVSVGSVGANTCAHDYDTILNGN